MVIVEGPDGAGKTTLVAELVEEFGFTVGERGVTDRSLLYTVTRPDTYNALADAILGGSPKVWDRLFFSEMVYAGLVGRKCEFSMYERHVITDVFRALRCPIVYCDAPLDVITANAAKAKQMKGVNENLPAIHAHYSRLWQAPPDHLEIIHYDYTEDSVELSVFTPVAEYLEQRKQREIQW